MCQREICQPEGKNWRERGGEERRSSVVNVLACFVYILCILDMRSVWVALCLLRPGVASPQGSAKQDPRLVRQTDSYISHPLLLLHLTLHFRISLVACPLRLSLWLAFLFDYLVMKLDFPHSRTFYPVSYPIPSSWLWLIECYISMSFYNSN